ncbi:hypothetical protein Tco_0414573 [Tanacetum coccineum]
MKKDEREWKGKVLTIGENVKMVEHRDDSTTLEGSVWMPILGIFLFCSVLFGDMGLSRIVEMVMKEVEVKQAATKGGVFDSTANRATSAQGSVWMHPRLSVLFCLVNVNGECVQYTPFRFRYIRICNPVYTFDYVMFASLVVRLGMWLGIVLRNEGNGGERSGNDKQAVTKWRNSESTANRATGASGTVSENSLSVRS